MEYARGRYKIIRICRLLPKLFTGDWRVGCQMSVVKGPPRVPTPPSQEVTWSMDEMIRNNRLTKQMAMVRNARGHCTIRIPPSPSPSPSLVLSFSRSLSFFNTLARRVLAGAVSRRIHTRRAAADPTPSHPTPPHPTPYNLITPASAGISPTQRRNRGRGAWQRSLRICKGARSMTLALLR